MPKAAIQPKTGSRLPSKINRPSNDWIGTEDSTRIIDLKDEPIEQGEPPAEDQGTVQAVALDSDCDNGSKMPSARAKKKNRNRARAKKHAKRKAKDTGKPIKQPKAMPGDAEAKEINEEHDALTEELVGVAAEAVPKAIRIGEKLQKIKKAVGHGHFEKWVEKHLTFDIRTARRYMARAKANRTGVTDLKVCATIMSEHAADDIAPKETTHRAVPFKVFTPAATKVLNLPVEEIAVENKETLRAEFERLEPIALQLYDHPSIFTPSWQKKLMEPPVRWARKDVELFRADVAKAEAIRAELDKDAQFDDEPDAPATQVEAPAPMEGDAP